MSILDRFTRGLTRTREAFAEALNSAFRTGRTLEATDYEALEAALLRADVGPATTDRVLDGVRRRLGDASFTGDARRALAIEIGSILAGGTDETSTPGPGARPFVSLLVGVNGSGKTTSIAKLASRARSEGQSVLLVACDTFRAAAADQLEVWADRARVELLRQAPGADPAAVAYDGMIRAVRAGVDRVYVDTAGRLHVKANLMAELEKIRRVVGKALPGAPHETLLVLDATTGQNGLAQAAEFHRALGLSGIVLTKLDGSAKGGVTLAIVHSLGIPIRWIGVGEGMEDLVPFEPDTFASALVGAAP